MINHIDFFPSLFARLEQFEDNEFVSVVDFIEGLGAMVMNEQNETTIHRASVVGKQSIVKLRLRHHAKHYNKTM